MFYSSQKFTGIAVIGSPFFMQEIFIIGLILVIIVREVFNFIERREMLDRLMSRNINEYKDNIKPEKNNYGEPSNLEPLENHREDIDE